MNTTRKLTLNILGVFAMGVLNQGCDSSDQKAHTPTASATPENGAPRAVNVKHRAKDPSACEAAIQVCVNDYEACTPDGSEPNSCPHKLHECVLETLGSEACLPDSEDKKKKKKKKKKKGCDEGESDADKDKEKDDCDKDFEDGDPDFEDGDPDFEDGDPDFEDGDPDFEDGIPGDDDDDIELGDEDDIPDFEECEDLNFFAKIAKNLGLNLKIAHCKK